MIRPSRPRRPAARSLLQAVARAAAGSLDADRILDDSLDLLLRHLPVDAASIHLLDPETREILSVPSRGVRRSDLEGEAAGGPDPRAEARRAAQSGKVTITRRASASGAARSQACVPLKGPDRVLGMLLLTSRAGRTFTPSDRRTLQEVGVHVGRALDNARLFAEANQRSRVLAALNAISQVLSQSPKLEESLGLTLARILEVTQREGGSVYLRDGDTPAFVLAVHRIHPGHFVREPVRVLPGEGDVGSVVASGEMLVMPARPPAGGNGKSGPMPFSFAELGEAISPAAVLPERVAATPPPASSEFPAPERLDAFRAALAPAATSDFLSFACVPLKAKGQVLGVLKVGSFSRPGFSHEELQLLAALGAQMGVALENALQYRTISEQASRLARRANQLSAVLEISQLMASSVEVEEPLRDCLARLGKLLGIPRITITLDQGDGCAVVAASYDDTVGKTYPEGAQVRWEDFPIASRVLESQEMKLLDAGATELSETEARWLEVSGVRSSLVLPLVANGAALGVLSLSSTRAPRPIYPSDVDFGRIVANQIAVALERARLFRQVKDFAGALEERVEKRTRALRETNVRLQEVTRQRADFLSVVSHELRTPLNAILGFSEVMADRETELSMEEVREYSAHVHDSGRSLLRLINDILDLAKPGGMSDRLSMDRLPLEPLLRGLLDVIRPQAVARSVTLRLDAPPDLPPVLADRSRLKQILYNLLSNAVKFSPPRGVVTLGARPEGRRAVLWVEDAGPGIPREFHERIFEPFFQIDQSISRSYEGAGLGLTLARRCARLHGGDLVVRSEPGQGSRFEFTVALEEDPV